LTRTASNCVARVLHAQASFNAWKQLFLLRYRLGKQIYSL